MKMTRVCKTKFLLHMYSLVSPHPADQQEETFQMLQVLLEMIKLMVGGKPGQGPKIFKRNHI